MTREVIDQRPPFPHDAAMNLKTFLIVDSVLLDIAGAVALAEGATALALAVLAVAVITFVIAVTRKPERSLA
jgi:hypothetical protein